MRLLEQRANARCPPQLASAENSHKTIATKLENKKSHRTISRYVQVEKGRSMVYKKKKKKKKNKKKKKKKNYQ